MNEIIYSPEVIIRDYAHIIIPTLREHILKERDRSLNAIELIYQALQIDHNFEKEFDDWLLEMVEEKLVPEQLADVLSKLRDTALESDKEWKSVYYGIKRIRVD